MKNSSNAFLSFLTAYLIIYVCLFGVSRIHMWIRDQRLKSKIKKDKLCEACKTLNINKEDLEKMTKKKLKEIYRKLVHKCHPDHGGSADDFRKVKESFDFVYTSI